MYELCLLAVVSNSLGSVSIVGFDKKEVNHPDAPSIEGTRNAMVVAKAAAENILPDEAKE